MRIFPRLNAPLVDYLRRGAHSTRVASRVHDALIKKSRAAISREADDGNRRFSPFRLENERPCFSSPPRRVPCYFFFFRYFLSGALLEVVFASKNLGKTARHDPAREKPGRAGRAAREITMPRDTRNPRVITSRSGPAATDGSSGNDNLHFSGTPLERRTREHAPLFLPR